MKILIITPFFPYSKVTHAGGEFLYELIRELSKKCDIDLISRIEPEEKKYLHEMNSLCKKVLVYEFKTPESGNLIKIPLIILSYIKLALKANRHLYQNSYDLIQVEFTETGLFLKRQKNTPMVLDSHDVITKRAERNYSTSLGVLEKIISWCLWKITKFIEIYISRKFSVVLTRPHADLEYLKKMDGRLSVLPITHGFKIYGKKNIQRENNTILFAGALNRQLNQQAVIFLCEKIFPEVKKKIPDLTFYVAGNAPPESIKKYAENDSKIIITGFVDDIMVYYQKATLFVSPLFVGGGIIQKNIDAMGSGLAVITTSIGNEGIMAEDGREIVIADNAERFIFHIVRLLKDEKLRESIGASGKRFAEEHFGIKQVIKDLERAYELSFKICGKSRV